MLKVRELADSDWENFQEEVRLTNCLHGALIQYKTINIISAHFMTSMVQIISLNKKVSVEEAGLLDVQSNINIYLLSKRDDETVYVR